MKKIVICVCIITLAIVGFIYARRTSVLFNFLLPPSDMFVALASTEANLTKTNKVQLPFQPKYPGEYQLDLEVEKFEFGKPFKGKIQLEITVKNKKNDSVITRKVAKPISSFLGTKTKGFILESFMVPDQIAIGEKGTVEVTILTADPDFPTSYGSAKFVVNKGGDK